MSNFKSHRPHRKGSRNGDCKGSNGTLVHNDHRNPLHTCATTGEGRGYFKHFLKLGPQNGPQKPSEIAPGAFFVPRIGESPDAQEGTRNPTVLYYLVLLVTNKH